MSKLFACSASVLLTVAAAMPTVAQTESGVGYQLEEVIVTAEKREENLQKVSTSIQVRDGKALREEGKKRIDEIMQGTVGIQMQDAQVGVSFFIRGVDSGGETAVNGTPLIVDGVSQTRTESVRGGSLDLARAEVMRGPQSTGLGANSLSGAISLVSNQPVFDYEGAATLEVGNYHKQSAEGVLNVPLSTNQAIRIAYASDKRDGFISSGGGESDITNARLKYRWQANDAVNVVGTISHQQLGGNGVQARQLLAYANWLPYSKALASQYNVAFTTTVPGAIGGMGPNPPLAPGVSVSNNTCQVQSANYSNQGVGGRAPTIGGVLLGNPILGCPVSYIAVVDGSTFRTRANAWSDGLPSNPWSNHAFRDTSITQGSVEVNWTTEMGTVTFLPSYQDAHFTSTEPLTYMGFMVEDVTQRTEIVDLRMNSKNGGRLVWQAGLYYSNDKKNTLFGSANLPGTAGMGPADLTGDCLNSTFFDNNSICWSYQSTPNVDRVGQSVYGNAEYSVLDTLRLVGGVRYNNDKATIKQFNSVYGTRDGPNATGPLSLANITLATRAINGVVVPIDYSATWKETTYRAGLEWDVTPNSMIYGVYSTGYTPGSLDFMQTDPSKKAVTLDQLSLGWKTQFLDNRLQWNAEAFVTKFHNRDLEGSVNTYLGNAQSATCTAPMGATPATTFQVGTDTASGDLCGLTDAPTVKEFVSKGLDMDLTWLITANDRLTVTAEYLKAVYEVRPEVRVDGVVTQITSDYIRSASVNGGGPTISVAQATALAAAFNATLDAFKGSTLQNAPKYSATLDYSHSFVFAKGSRLTPRLSGTYKQKYWSFGSGGMGAANLQDIVQASNDPNSLAWQQAYTKWDFLTSWDNADGRFNVTGYIRNLDNKAVMSGFLDPYVSLEAPRTIGITFSGKF